MKSIEFITEASIFDERTLKNTNWTKPSHLIKWLEKHGFTELGHGSYAAVCAKPGHNRVVKVSTTQDDCWIAFAQYAQSKTNNPHLPKIPWIKRYQADAIDSGIIEEFFVTIIERLKPLDDQAISKITDPGTLFGFMMYTNLEPAAEASFLNTLQNHKTPDMFQGYGLEVKYHNHPFVKTLRHITSISPDCWSDLHSNNFMVRGDGTIVITDPLAAK